MDRKACIEDDACVVKSKVKITMRVGIEGLRIHSCGGRGVFSRVLLHRHSSFSPWKWSPTQCFVDGLIAECIIVSSSLPVSGTSTSDDFHVQSDVSRRRRLSGTYLPWADVFVLG